MTIPTAPFGRTGHASTRAIFGGAALSQVSRAEADRTFDLIMEAGINHLDVAASYGEAEDQVRPWLSRAPGHFFLATKTAERQAGKARQELEKSLERMGVDHVDLWQLHNLVDPIDWDTALSPGGALEAAVQARHEGLVRFIGITGHGAQVAATHMRSLERFDFDSVLLPYSWVMMQNPYYAQNFDSVAATCRARNVAVQTIKSIAVGPWAGREKTAAPWYEPLTAQEEIDLAVWWVMANEDVFLNMVSDVEILPKVLSAASRLSARPSDDEMRAMTERCHVEPLFV